jgi:hypothetical protein
LKFFTLFAEGFHVEVTMGFDPVLVDLDGESANESQSTLLVGEDANDMGAALNHMIESLKHVGAFEMLVMFSRQPIESESFFNVLFYPRAETRILLLPAQQPGGDHRLTPSFSHRLTQIHADTGELVRRRQRTPALAVAPVRLVHRAIFAQRSKCEIRVNR